MAAALDRTGRGFRNFVIVVVQALAVLGFSALVLLLIATGVNSFVRWNAQRTSQTDAQAERSERAKENLLIVGLEGDRAVGFLAVRVDRENSQIFGIAVPDGAFIEVPGQGFERMGESWPAGPETSLAAISNYFTVPFDSYVAVPAEAYRDTVQSQDLSAVSGKVTESNLTEDQLAVLAKEIAGIPQKNVALVPMPVKPIKLGDQTYFEPQREAIADLLQQWWGVDPSEAAQATRVIVYNGAGMPGIAGEAAQELIRAGFRVVDTKNADRFDYKTTLITVTDGDKALGDKVRDVLGVGEVTVKPAEATVTDVIVIVGKDYKPQSSGTTGGNE